MFTIILVLAISQERITILIFLILQFRIHLTWCSIHNSVYSLASAHVVGLPWLGTGPLHQVNMCIWSYLEQEAKMSSLVWICHELNSSHNQRVVVTLDLECPHCTKSLPGRLGSHYSWMKWSFSGGLIVPVSSWKATNLHMQHSSILCEANITDRQMFQWH